MKPNLIEASLIAALIGVAALTVAPAFTSPAIANHMNPEPQTDPRYPWHLVEELTLSDTDRPHFVVDEFADIGDCWAALASTSNRFTYRNQRISFSCERTTR